MDRDPYFFDREDLQTIAADKTIRQGLAYYKENRVIDLAHDQEMLWGRVEDDDSDIPFDAEMRLTDGGAPVFTCQCTACADDAACRHMVAVLYAYADRRGETGQLMSAADSAIKERIKRGRSEVQVESVDGEPWFGAWRASSVTSTTHFPRHYRVTVRSLHRRSNFCTCPDFANNQLGTCKHIEAVLHKIRKHPQYKKFREQPAPFPYVYLAWDVENAPQLRLHRTPSMPRELQTILADYFDAAGGLLGRLPDNFFRTQEAVGERSDINIGEDAADYARRLATAAAHRLRAAEIRARITSGNGRLPGISARLYPYQIEGTAFLAGTGRALLADDMGLGKTLQAISAAVWLQEHENARKTLIVCPASLKQQWAREIKKFAGRECQIIQGPPPARAAQYRRDSGFFIINYELLLRDLSMLNETMRPDLLVLDEAQRLKNWRTKIASAVKLVPSRYAFVLSGTPLENRLEDLYSLMQVVDPKILGPLWRYMIDFHVTDERGKVLGCRNLSLLRQRIAPVMLRRDRRLVKDQLPDRINQRLDVVMTAKQIELHNDAMHTAGLIADIAKKRPLTPAEQNRLMAALQQARMACNAAGLVDKKTEGSPKLDELAAILDELCLQSGLKAVVFSQWELMTRMVEERLRRMKLGFVRLHGGVPTPKRGELMDRFREDDGVQVFISTDAGGVGLNLQSGSVLVNLDVPWNPAVLEQRNGRVHRLGQTRKVQIITMVAADSYEEHVLSLVQGKQHLFDNVIAEDATEDVVGVSKKLLETLVEDLTTQPQEAGPAETAEATAENMETPSPAVEPGQPMVAAAREKDRAVEEAIAGCIEELQKALGSRIERILGSGGGLLAVIDRVDAEADTVAARLSATVPVAVIDRCTLNGLSRLGAASPVVVSHTYYDASQQTTASGMPRLTALAVEKLRAARVLMEQQCQSSAVELLLSALLAAAAGRAGLDEPVAAREAGVWIYGEALPKGLLNQEEAGLIMRGITLAQSQSVPEPLISGLLGDVEIFIQP
ncbi:MAG: DEAD/DEAH box helicase [Deltaproteobacteria bacterium]|nr:DEAD/DEAH box helicase [Deltaproteobacteria bacterium]